MFQEVGRCNRLTMPIFYPHPGLILTYFGNIRSIQYIIYNVTDNDSKSTVPKHIHYPVVTE